MARAVDLAGAGGGLQPSSRSVVTGSTWAARVAGRNPASRPISVVDTQARASAAGSSGETSNNRFFMTRVSATVPSMPKTSPAATIPSALRKMRESTSPERAPKAMRMPISRRCSVTECESTP